MSRQIEGKSDTDEDVVGDIESSSESEEQHDGAFAIKFTKAFLVSAFMIYLQSFSPNFLYGSLDISYNYID